MSAVCDLLVGIHEYIFQKISALFFNRSSTENLSPAWVSWIIPSRSSKPAEIIYLSTFQVIFTIKKNPCIYIMCVCFGRAPEQRKWSPVMHPKKEIAIFEMYYFHFLSSLLICTMLFFLNQRPVAKSTIIHWLTQSTCLSQCCCCLNIIDFTYQ